MSQDGFGLVIRRMGYSHAVQSARGCCRSEKTIAQPAGGIFEIQPVAESFAPHVGPIAYEFKVERLSQFLDKSLIFICVRSAQLMVKMKDENPDSKFRSQFNKETKQGHGIRP